MSRKSSSARLHRLTVREVMVATDGDHLDGGNLMLRVRGASCSWVFRYTSPTGLRREMGLGAAQRGSGALAGASLTTARSIAADARTLVQRGIDPIDDRERRKTVDRAAAAAAKAAKARESLTLARAARDYHARVVEPARTPKHAAQWIASLEHHVPSDIWHMPISEVQPPALLAALSAVRALDDLAVRVPETLQRIRQRLDAVFEDAMFHGHCKTNPAAAVRRKLREETPRKERGQYRALSYREAPAFMQRLRQAEGTAARTLEFAVLTAARTGEVLQAGWSEFDLEAAEWRIPGGRMKGKEEHVVHLTKRALEIVRSQLGQDTNWVFPSIMKPNSPQSNMAMLVLLDRLGVRQRTTVHGLCRATFSTWANETGAGRPDVIEACLAHEESNRVRAAYNRARFTEERRTLLDAWAQYLEQPTLNVVTLKAA